MESKELNSGANDYNRREFIQNAASFGAMMALMGAVPLHAEEKNAESGETDYITAPTPMNCAVIGCGAWGREILHTLSLCEYRPKNLPAVALAPVMAICDNYEGAFRRAKEAAPNAETFTDFHKLLEKKEVQGVIVATPSHLHREVVEAALAAGKHVYCEAPLASSVEDARAIAKAAKAAVKLNFQTGLQMRADSGRHFLLPFIRSGACGKNVYARSQWHKKDSWLRPAPNPERVKALNWRLHAATSSGLLGEVGIHQMDLISWMLNRRPTAISGSSRIALWTDDGRDVADTVHAVYEYADGMNYFQHCTLANSFDSSYEVLYGTDSAVMMRTDPQDQVNRQWLFKEVDSPLLGWEVYARKEQFYQETGITLMMGASKLKQVAKTGQTLAPEVTPLQKALTAFIANSGTIGRGVANFFGTYGEDADTDALPEYLAGLTKGKDYLHAANWKDGLEATVIALKANEAVSKGQRIVLQKEWFEV